MRPDLNTRCEGEKSSSRVIADASVSGGWTVMIMPLKALVDCFKLLLKLNIDEEIIHSVSNVWMRYFWPMH